MDLSLLPTGEEEEEGNDAGAVCSNKAPLNGWVNLDSSNSNLRSILKTAAALSPPSFAVVAAVRDMID